MAADHQFFYEDEVFRVDKRGKIMFGMVVENYKLYSSDDSASSREDDEPKVEEGHIRVAWHPHGRKEVISEKKVGLANRSLMPGDVVRRLNWGEHSMKGYCGNIHVNACVQIKGTKQIIENVDSKSLIPFEKLSSGTAIVMDSWVGGVQLVHTRLTLLLRDGSKCYLNDPESYCFLSCSEQNDKFTENYYPGQCLRGMIKYLDSAEWIHCTKRTKALLASKSTKKIKVFVEAVDTVSALVDWKCQICCKDGDTSGKPLHTTIMGEDFKKLRLLNYFKACTLQVGDRNLYQLKETDKLLTVSEWKKSLKEKLAMNGRNLPKPSEDSSRLSRKRSYCKSQAEGTSPSAERKDLEELEVNGAASSNDNSDDYEMLDSNVKRHNRSWMQNLYGMAKPTINEVHSLIHLSQKEVCGHFSRTNSVDGSSISPVSVVDSGSDNKSQEKFVSSNEMNSAISPEETKSELTNAVEASSMIRPIFRGIDTSDPSCVAELTAKGQNKSWMQNLLGMAKPTIDEVQSLINLSQRKVCGHFSKASSVENNNSKNSSQTKDNFSSQEKSVETPNDTNEGDSKPFIDLRNLPIVTENATAKYSEVLKSTMKSTLNALNNSDWKDFNVKGAKEEENMLNLNSVESFPPLEGGEDCLNDWESVDSESDDDSSDEEGDVNAKGLDENGPSSLSSTCSSTVSNASNSQRAINKASVKLVAKVLKKKKKSKAGTRPKKRLDVDVKPGDKLVVETVRTFSAADVVWQDGSIEVGIPSTDLYPIHHLDDQEFFPGDFVIENQTDDTELLDCVGIEKYGNRLYGVVQSVNHIGRTAKLKWFLTYVSSSDPIPALVHENEMSVYDLKDHPDFQFRPGDVVVRLGNIDHEHQNATAGQILDVFPEGKVCVWWAEGFKTMSWPQDLYKLNDTDSDDSEIWEHSGSEGVWETDSEEVVYTPSSPTLDNNIIWKLKLANNIEKTRTAIKRLEKILQENPSLLTADHVKKFLGVYKDCRYLNNFLGTQFHSLTQKVKDLERIADPQTSANQACDDQISKNVVEPKSALAVELQNASKSESLSSPMEGEAGHLASPELDISEEFWWSTPPEKKNEKSPSPMLREFLSTSLADLEVFNKLLQQADSALGILNKENSNSDGPLSTGQGDQSTDGEGNAINDTTICLQLCALILAQLLKAQAEVYKRFGKNFESNVEATILEEEVPMEVNTEKLTPFVGPIPDSPESPEPENVDVCPDTGAILYRTSKSVLDLLAAEQNLQSAIHQENNGSTDSGVEAEFELAPSLTKVLVQKEGEGFSMLSSVSECHKYESSKYVVPLANNPRNFMKTVNTEIKLLLTSLPCGITVKGFEGRMDLYSAMIEGPQNTPYEDGLFFFDFQLPSDYPDQPPLCHYISYCTERLNPNLYEDGKVCVSLLGTWSGRGTEVWTSSSNLLQVLVSIQGLILVCEPYYNEAGYENQKGTQQGHSNSQLYNEMVILKLVQAMTKLLKMPPSTFEQEIMNFFSVRAEKLINRLESWLSISENHFSLASSQIDLQEKQERLKKLGNVKPPEFPLLPASNGLCFSLRKALASFKDTLKLVGIVVNNVSADENKSQVVIAKNKVTSEDSIKSEVRSEVETKCDVSSEVQDVQPCRLHKVEPDDSSVGSSNNLEDSALKSAEADENLVNRVSSIQVRKVDRSKGCVEKIKSLSKIEDNFKSGQNNISSLKSSSSKS